MSEPLPEYNDIMSLLLKILTEIQTANATLKLIATNTTPKK